MTTSTLATLTIGGEAQPGAAGSYPVHNPARPAEIAGHAPAADRAQLDAAVSAARRAAPGWRALDVAERVAKVAAAAATAAEQLTERDGARLYTREHGKVLSEASFEIDTAPVVASVLGSMAEAALAPEQIDPQSAYPRLHREPYGVAALVIPFNWPLAVMMTKLTSALTAGNTAVVKLPPTVPLAALQFGAAFAEALPPGVVNVLSAPGVEVAQMLVTHPGIDVISLTGGPATGRAVMAAAAPRLTPLLLELGGNDAAIIAPDMTISDQLIEQLVAATYTTGGQVCMAIKRLYAPRDRVDELAEAVLNRCEREVVGDGLAPEVTLGPLHTAAGRDRVECQRCCGPRGDGPHRGTDPRGRRRRRRILRAADCRDRRGAGLGAGQRGTVRPGASDLRLRRHRRRRRRGERHRLRPYRVGVDGRRCAGRQGLSAARRGHGQCQLSRHGSPGPARAVRRRRTVGPRPRARRRRHPGVHPGARLRPPAGAAVATLISGPGASTMNECD